jgi:hypothetical protein
MVTHHLKRHSRVTPGTVLHTRMYLAVSAGLNRIVSVRNTVVAHDGNYPLRLSRIRLRVYSMTVCSDFPHEFYLARLPNKEQNYYTIENVFCTAIPLFLLLFQDIPRAFLIVQQQAQEHTLHPAY